MKKIIMAIVIVGVVGAGLSMQWVRSARAARPLAPPAYQAELEEFWRRWEGDKPSEAIRHAAATPDIQRAWEVAGRAADDFQNRAGGKCLGHSEIIRKPLGERMEYIAFYALYEPTPIRVQMLYYCSKDRWTAISLRVDSGPGRWLDEASQTVQTQVVVEPQEQRE